MIELISGKRYWSDGTPVAGQQDEYVFDDIGNRTSAKSGGNSSGTGLRTESYTRNRLNQHTQKDEANTFDVLGLANASATVTVNGSSAYRKNEYFHKEVSVSNGSAPVWQSVSTIASLGGSTTTNMCPGRVGWATACPAHVHRWVSRAGELPTPPRPCPCRECSRECGRSSGT